MSAGELEIKNLSVCYGPISAVTDVCLTVRRGTIVGLIGPNGAGKTSLLRAVSGLVPAKSGQVLLDGHLVSGLPPHKITRRGLAHVPEGRRIIAPLTVEENLLLSAGVARHSRKNAQENIAMVYDLFTPLAKLRHREGGALSGGEQQMLAFGRALVQRPRFLLLDEPSMGLAPIMINAIFDMLSKPPPMVSEMGILLAEQSAVLALEVASYAYVISGGQVRLEGPAEELKEGSHALEAYLGAAS